MKSVLYMVSDYSNDRMIVEKVLTEGFFSEEKWDHAVEISTNKHRFSETLENRITHVDVITAKRCAYDLIEMNPMSVPDVETLGRLGKAESLFLRMMDRMEPTTGDVPGQLSYEQRKRLYLKQVCYWYGMIKKYSVGVMLAWGRPHIGFDYVIYELCKILNIPVLIINECGQVPGVMFWTDSVEEYAPELKNAYARLKSGERFQRTPTSQLRNAILLHYRWRRNSSKPMPNWDKSRPESLEFEALKQKTENRFFWFQVQYQVLKILKIKKLKERVRHELIQERKKITDYDRSVRLSASYKRLQWNGALTEKYIYCPLHFQPECTSNPQGGYYQEQWLMVATLVEALPAGWVVVTKENPHQNRISRNLDYYEDLHLLRKVKILPMEADTFELIENSQAVATISGTVGWEALFLEKPVLLFGSNFYQYADGVFRVSSVESVREAVNQIIQGHCKPTLQDVRRYMRAMAISGEYGIVYKTSEIAFKMIYGKYHRNVEEDDSIAVESTARKTMEFLKSKSLLT